MVVLMPMRVKMLLLEMIKLQLRLKNAFVRDVDDDGGGNADDDCQSS